MRNDYHILHHKVRETQNALSSANKVNHDLEDRSKALEKTNSQLQSELEATKKQKIADATGVNPALLSGDAADDLDGLGSDEIANLLMRRQDAMKSRIGTLQAKIQEISRREAEERSVKPSALICAMLLCGYCFALIGAMRDSFAVLLKSLMLLSSCLHTSLHLTKIRRGTAQSRGHGRLQRWS